MNVTDTTLPESTESLTTSGSVGYFFIGLGITLGASVLNAFGLNLTKLDHARNAALPRSQRKPEWMRPLSIAGLLSYVTSQLVGSTLALEYLRSEFVAPLGSSSLIFNFLFAYLLVKTKIVKTDFIGTAIIILGVVLVILFGNNRSKDAADVESELSLSVLKRLWGRAAWLSYFFILEFITAVVYWVAAIFDDVWSEREEIAEEGNVPEEDRYGRGSLRTERIDTFWQKVVSYRDFARNWIKSKLAQWAEKKPDVSVKKLGGFLWAFEAGLLSGQTLIFAKSAVKLFSTNAKHTDGNQFASPLSLLILILLAVTAILQILCLNKGLRIADSTLVVPVLFACYSGTSFINSLIYLDQTNAYTKTTTAFIVLSLLILVAGVSILASKKPEVQPKAPRADLEENPFDDPQLHHDDASINMKVFSHEDEEDVSLEEVVPVLEKEKAVHVTESPFEDSYRVEASTSQDEFDDFVKADEEDKR